MCGYRFLTLGRKVVEVRRVVFERATEHRLPVCVTLDLTVNRYETGRVAYASRVYSIFERASMAESGTLRKMS
jgi:hypothetical protein